MSNVWSVLDQRPTLPHVSRPNMRLTAGLAESCALPDTQNAVCVSRRPPFAEVAAQTGGRRSTATGLQSGISLFVLP